MLTRPSRQAAANGQPRHFNVGPRPLPTRKLSCWLALGGAAAPSHSSPSRPLAVQPRLPVCVALAVAGTTVPPGRCLQHTARLDALLRWRLHLVVTHSRLSLTLYAPQLTQNRSRRSSGIHSRRLRRINHSQRRPLVPMGICVSSSPPDQPAPQRAGHAPGRSAPPPNTGSGAQKASADDPAEAARRRAERAAAAESRAKASQNRGKSSNGASSQANGKSSNNLYGDLGGGGGGANALSPNGSKREKSQWEIENQEALGASIIHTNEKA